MKRDDAINDALLGAITGYMIDPERIARFVAGVIAAVASIIEIEATVAADLLHIEADISLITQEWVATLPNRLKNVNTVTLRYIQSILEEAIESGWSVEYTAKRITELFGQAYNFRARNIARTETLGASNFAAWRVFGSLAVPFKRWVATIDDKTRITHLDAHWQIQSIFDPFVVGGHLFMYPGDPNAPAKEAVNCRCTLLPEWNPERSIWTVEHTKAIWKRYLVRTTQEEEILLTSVRQQFAEQYQGVMSILGAKTNGRAENPRMAS